MTETEHNRQDAVVFICSHGAEYTALECELGMRLVDLDMVMERERLAYELDQDLAYEEQLARRSAIGDLDCPWPWYADGPTEVQESEVVPR